MRENAYGSVFELFFYFMVASIIFLFCVVYLFAIQFACSFYLSHNPICTLVSISTSGFILPSSASNPHAISKSLEECRLAKQIDAKQIFKKTPCWGLADINTESSVLSSFLQYGGVF